MPQPTLGDVHVNRPLTNVSVAYTISKDSSGYTIAKNSATGATDFRNSNSRTVIQQAVDRLSSGYVLIKAGSYVITQTIYTDKVSIIGEGNGTLLESGSSCYGAVIRVTNDYWTLDNRYMSARPNGITIGNLQIDGNAGSGGSVAINNAADLYLYANTIYAVKVTGAP